MTVEGVIKIVYDLLKDQLNIVRIAFTSGDNTASECFPITCERERCPMCGALMNDKEICIKCWYVNKK